MVEQRNIIILGASFAGIQSAQYVTNHILPLLNARHNAKYHVYVISPSSHFFYRPASPRVGTSITLMSAEKIFTPLSEVFKRLPASDFTFVQAFATGLDTAAQKVAFSRGEHLPNESLPYHALIVATGSNTYHPAYSMHANTSTTLDAIKTLNKQVAAARDIIVVGGGATGVEAAAEMGEHLNGKPGWFSNPPRKVNITLITAADQLLPTLRPTIGKAAEDKLKDLGVDVLYNTRVANTSESEDGRTMIFLTTGGNLEADLYIPAHGVSPNSAFLPSELVNKSGYLKTNPLTMRVDVAGPRVYALGDISSASRNNVIDIADSLPVVMTNLKRDLFTFKHSSPDIPAPGKDRHFMPVQKEMMGVVMGTGGGGGCWRDVRVEASESVNQVSEG